MIYSPDADDSLAICNGLLMQRDQYEMDRAARFSAAGRERDAERIRAKLGYCSADCRDDVSKLT